MSSCEATCILIHNLKMLWAAILTIRQWPKQKERSFFHVWNSCHKIEIRIIGGGS
jgi:hypothetical protein